MVGRMSIWLLGCIEQMWLREWCFKVIRDFASGHAHHDRWTILYWRWNLQLSKKKQETIVYSPWTDICNSLIVLVAPINSRVLPMKYHRGLPLRWKQQILQHLSPQNSILPFKNVLYDDQRNNCRWRLMTFIKNSKTKDSINVQLINNKLKSLYL